MDPDPDRRTVGSLFVLCSAVCFGSLGVLGEVAFSAGLSVTATLALRFAVGTGVVWGGLLVVRAATASAPPLRLPAREAGVALALGGVGYAGLSLGYFVGVERMSAGLAAVLLYTYPLFVVALAAVLLDERVGPRTVAAAVATLAGVTLVSWTGTAAFDPVGAAATVGGAACYAVYIVAGRAVLDAVDERTLTAYVVPATAVSLAAVGWATGSLALPATTAGWGAVVALGVVATGVAMFAFFAGLKRVGASRTGVLSTVEPATAVALGAAFLDERVTPAVLVGGALILAGVVVVRTAGE